MLEVKKKRPDQYHELDMINAQAELHDTVTVRLKKGTGAVLLQLEQHLPCKQLGREIPCDPITNLASRAAEAWLKRFEITDQDVEIDLIKRIPPQSGLGGASANAAQVLLALEELASKAFDKSRDHQKQLLTQIAFELGADVPYCLSGGWRRVGGIGENLTEIRSPLRKNMPLLFYFPRVGLSTKEVFAALAHVPPNPHYRSSQEKALVEESWNYSKLLQVIFNQLEAPARLLSQELEEAFSYVEKLSSCRFWMSGSGSTLCILPHEEQEPARLFEERVAKSLETLPGVLFQTSLLANS